MFTEQEIAYIKSQRLTRIATVSADMQPDVAAVGFEFDGHYLYVGGHGDARSRRKHKNVESGNHKVALIMDDLVSVQPWVARGIRIYGTAEVVERNGMFGPGWYLRITPTTSWSWGINPVEPGQQFSMTRTKHGS